MAILDLNTVFHLNMGAVELLAAHETKTQTISTTALYDWERQKVMLVCLTE